MANWWYWVTLEHKRVDSSMGHLTLSNMMSAGDNIFSHLILSSPGAQWNYFLLRRGRRITRVAGVVCCTAQLAPTWDVKQSIAGCVPPGNFWVCKLSSCCWTLRAGGTCTLLRTSFVDMNTGRQSIKSGKYPWCSDLSLCGKNMHSTKARFALLICKLSPAGVVTLQHFLPKLSGMGPMGFTDIGDWVGRGVSDDFHDEFMRGNPELPLVTRAVLCAKIFS